MNELTTVSNTMDIMSLGEVLKRSGYFSDVKEASQAIVKILAGQELGIGPVAAMTGIYIVKGRVTLSANLMAAQIKRSGHYDYHVTRIDDTGCEITFYQDKEPIGVSTFTEADAKAAGLLGGENWKKYPRNMYFARALSNGAKWYCPDLFAGPVYTPDEMGSSISYESSYVDTTTGEIIDQLPVEEPPQKAPVKVPEKPQEAPKSTPPIAASPKRIAALRTLWDREKELGISVHIPPADLAIDLDNPEEATVDRVNELGKAARARVLAYEAAQEQQPV